MVKQPPSSIKQFIYFYSLFIWLLTEVTGAKAKSEFVTTVVFIRFALKKNPLRYEADCCVACSMLDALLLCEFIVCGT